MNYFELYPGDYLRDTSRLTLLQHGVYLRLLMAYYSEEAPLPADECELQVIVSAVTPADKVALRKVADRFFPIAADGLRRNSRADAEIAKARKRINAARRNGAKNQPTKSPAGDPEGDPPGMPVGTQRDTHSGEALHAPHVNQEIPPTAGASAPPSDPIFGEGLDFLKRKGIREGSARSFLGLLRKELHDDLTVAELLVEAERQDVSNPQAWLTRAAKQRKSEGGTNGNGRQSGKASLVERMRIANADADERDSRGTIEGDFRLTGTA